MRWTAITKHFWNNRGETPVQAQLDELEKLKRDNAALGHRLRAWDKIKSELGNSLELDQNGYPVRLITENPNPTPNASRTPAYYGSHPLASFEQYAPEGWTPQAIDDYYSKLFQSQGYLTIAQYNEREKLLNQSAQNYTVSSLKLYDNIKRTESKYDWLSKPDDPRYQKTVAALKSQGLAMPVSENPSSWLDYSWNDIEGLSKAAEIAEAKQILEERDKTAAQSQALANQNAANIADGGQSGAASADSKPNFASMSEHEEILDALDKVSK